MLNKAKGGALMALLTLLCACQMQQNGKPRRVGAVTVEETPAWQRVATPDDVARIERLDSAWKDALEEARKAGFARQIRAEGDLLDPSVALSRAAPAPGSYQCRVIRIGSTKPGGRAYVAHKPFFCHVGVKDDQLSITKQTGSERPGGYLWDTDDRSRLIFLGTLALGNEDMPRPYGEDNARDMAGVLQRYGDYRYRLAVPWPRQDSKLDIFELIALPPQP